MGMATPCGPTLLIDRNGKFNKGIEECLELAGESSLITAVSIIGVQSTGKSTLMNHLFETSFQVMDESQGMAQTTQGIWVAKCPSPAAGSPILVIDTEGSDGAEREDDVKFEKQTALFSLAISNTVIMNMKCDNVNLNNGGGRPLLRTVFEVMIKKFCTPRKVNLIFVLRDKNPVPLERLEEQLMAGLHKIWKGITKPQDQVDAALEDYFHIKVVAMPHFNHQKKEFIAEVPSLKELIMKCTTSDQLAKERMAASGFTDYAKNIWSMIKKDKDLDLPQERIMVAEVRCNAIAEEKYQSFCKDQSWIRIKKVAESSEIVQGFGNKVSSICEIYLNMYDKDAQYYHETKRDASKVRLIEKLLQAIEPTYQSLVGYMFDATLLSFQEGAVRNEIIKNSGLNKMKTKLITEFQNQLEDATIRLANWNLASKLITNLGSEMDSFIRRVRACNEILELQKKDRQIFWTRTLSIGVHLLNASVGMAAMIMVPGPGTVLGASALSASTMSILAALANENPRPSKELQSAVAAILKDAQRKEHMHGLKH